MGELAATVIVPSNTGPAVRLTAQFLLAGTRLPERVLLQPSAFPELPERAATAGSRRVG